MLDPYSEGFEMMGALEMVGNKREPRKTAARVTRDHMNRAIAGTPVPGRRLFGYMADGQRRNPEEAALAEEMIERALDGHSITSIAQRRFQQSGAQRFLGVVQVGQADALTRESLRVEVAPEPPLGRADRELRLGAQRVGQAREERLAAAVTGAVFTPSEWIVNRSSIRLPLVVRPKKSSVIVWLPAPVPGPRVGEPLGDSEALGVADGVVSAQAFVATPPMVATAAAPLARNTLRMKLRRSSPAADGSKRTSCPVGWSSSVIVAVPSRQLRRERASMRVIHRRSCRSVAK
jgi:hypothetical protein